MNGQAKCKNNAYFKHMIFSSSFKLLLQKYRLKNYFFVFADIVFLYISKMQVLKPRQMKARVKNSFLIKNIEILLGFSVIITFHCFVIFTEAFDWPNFDLPRLTELS